MGRGEGGGSIEKWRESRGGMTAGEVGLRSSSSGLCAEWMRKRRRRRTSRRERHVRERRRELPELMARVATLGMARVRSLKTSTESDVPTARKPPSAVREREWTCALQQKDVVITAESRSSPSAGSASARRHSCTTF